MKRAMKGTILLALFWLGGCGGGGSSNPTVTVTISPTTATVVLGGSQQFTATVSPSTVNQAVTWSVNGVTGGDIRTVGTISTLGLYTAPSPNVTTNPVTVTATSQADTTVSASATVTLNSGATVVVTPSSATLTAGNTFQFTATVTGSTTTAVTWQVNDITGGNSTVGSITQTGFYTAPSMVASQTTVTVKAVLQADTTRSGSATVTLVPPGAATLTQVSPPTVAQGSFFEDLYLIGANFLSTSTARVNGTTVPTSFINSNILRARVPASLLSSAGDHFVDVQQAGQISGALRVSVVPAAPALLSTLPESTPQNTSAPFSVTFDGGYYGTATSPAVTADFNEQPRPASVSSLNPRQLSVTLSPPDFNVAGLFAMRLRYAGSNPPTPSVAAANLAVVPPNTAPSSIATLTVGSQPSAVAVNTATGIAVVANRASNSITLIALTSPAPAICSPPPATFPGVCVAPIPVGMSPTGVAIDNLRNLAVVVNNGDNSISIINLSSPPSPPPVTTITSGVQPSPFSVGVNPLTGQGLITYQNSSNASFLDLTSSPQPTVVAPPTAVITTGLNPQVAIEPRLNWAIVTPGGSGSGTVSIVSLDRIGRTAVSTIAAPSANGAVRSSNVVTITTTAAHGLTPGEQVTISGVTDSSFNGGPFSVVSVPSSTTFTYNQTGSNATSGNGTVASGLPLVTLTLNPGIQGVGLNTETERVLLVDPTSVSITFFSLLDQSVINPPLTLETGHVAAAVNPLTDVAVTVNSQTNLASVIDLRTPQRLATLPVGTTPLGLAIDPVSDIAIVANQGSNNVSLINLGAIRPLQVTQVSPASTITTAPPSSPVSTIAAPSANGAVRSNNVVTITTTGAHGLTPGEQVTISGVTDSSFNGGPFSVVSVPSSTTFTYNQTAANATSGNGTVTALPLLTVIGSGFQPGAVVRLDETNLTTNVISSRKLTATVPTTMLAAPRQFALDVQNLGPDFSNVASFTVIQAVPVGTAPAAVAIDPDRDLGVVANSGSATATLVDLCQLPCGAGRIFGSIVATLNVGKNPQGAAVFSRAGRAVVTNFDDGTATILDLVNRAVSTTVTVGTNPLGVAIHPGTGQTVVANSGAQNLSFFDVQNPGTPTTLMVDQGPLAVAVDPTRNIAAVTQVSSSLNNLVIVDLSTTQIKNRVTGFQFPTGVLYDPALDVNFSGQASESFLVTSSLANNIVAVQPDTGATVAFRIGINPTSIARNHRSSTLVTVNSSSQTMSVMDFFANPTSPPTQTATVKAVLPLSGSLHFSLAVHPRTNLAVVVDPTNNRLLLVPLPR